MGQPPAFRKVQHVDGDAWPRRGAPGGWLDVLDTIDQAAWAEAAAARAVASAALWSQWRAFYDAEEHNR